MSIGYTTVSATNLCDSTGTVIANATIFFQPVDNRGNRISFRAGGTAGGQTSSKPVSTTVLDGAFSISLADTTMTSPINVGYSVTVIDNITGRCLLGDDGGYECVQPSGATFSFDTYVPNYAAQITVQYGPPGVGGGILRRGVPIGAIDGTNTSCTFSPEPLYIVAGIRNGSDNPNYTYSAGTVTWSTPLNPPNSSTGDNGDTHAFLCVYSS